MQMDPARVQAAQSEQNSPTQVSLSVLMPVYNERHLVATSLRRVLELNSPYLSWLEVIVVDDCSTDGSEQVLRALAAEEPRVKLYRHEKNGGKGAAVRTALSHAAGDVCIIHDADLEYNPQDIAQILVPFIEEGADAVFGSRYLSAPYRRVLMYRHTLINKYITTLTNWFSDLDLSDVETCYKAVKTPLLKSIPIRSNDFRLEVELTMKLAKRRARIFEVPIRYMPRSYEEGKKIRTKDGVLALQAILKYSLIDDIFYNDEYGSHTLNDLQNARRLNQWTGDILRPLIGEHILELGAGIGNLTAQFIPRSVYLASDINPIYLNYLKSYAQGKPYLHVAQIDANRAADFAALEGQFDTVLMVNLLEHLPDEQAALANIWRALRPGGKAVFLVPQNPRLFGTLDIMLGHRLRYTLAGFQSMLERAGFAVEKIFDHNRTAVPVWFVNARILKYNSFPRYQLKVLEVIMPIVRRIDRFLPWRGTSLIAVARKRQN